LKIALSDELDDRGPGGQEDGQDARRVGWVLSFRPLNSGCEISLSRGANDEQRILLMPA
jgi:hypothetical protein